VRSIQRLLGLTEPDDEERDTSTVRRIAAELDRLPVEQARYLAAFAYVLARVAHADLEISPGEVERMEELMAGHGLSKPQAALVVQLARHQATHFSGTEDYLVTRQFRELASAEQCLGLVHCLYEVAAAHGLVSAREDATIRQIANELRLTHAEVAAIRAQFKDHLAELRRE
jgi:uncharacterized tellurite resistance protein B-like protein